MSESSSSDESCYSYGESSSGTSSESSIAEGVGNFRIAKGSLRPSSFYFTKQFAHKLPNGPSTEPFSTKASSGICGTASLPPTPRTFGGLGP